MKLIDRTGQRYGRLVAISSHHRQVQSGVRTTTRVATLTAATASQMREVFKKEPYLTMSELGARFRVGRETARKVIRGLAW